jgi:hypothetical protein
MKLFVSCRPADVDDVERLHDRLAAVVVWVDNTRVLQFRD